ncbi:hypothetical protein [Dysgonomonas sp. ZJ709]|uniref:hypothetical protein n=1 Tax=Dysgonomonas sp. ZJ709 TaxID=2709797 RepID=UPI0013EC5DDC|nr:hypothetical protein [Dysgonomonas sp. ZJ709]
MRKTKLLRILFIVILCLVQASCQGQDKIIVTDKDAAIFDSDNPDNYSHNGYDLYPLLLGSYVMPLEIGSKWLVRYVEDGERSLKLKFHTITDTMTYGKYDRYPFIGPIFDGNIQIASKVGSSGQVTYFFKGFKSYNKKFDESFGIELPTDYEDVYDDNDNYEHTNYISRWEMNEKVMTFIDLKHDKEQNKLNEITFSDGNISQILLKYKYIFECELISALDYDGDGKSDIILRMEKWSDFVENKNKSEYYYLLFLSSEAEEGQLVKHVATRKIESINDLGVNNGE